MTGAIYFSFELTHKHNSGGSCVAIAFLSSNSLMAPELKGWLTGKGGRKNKEKDEESKNRNCVKSVLISVGPPAPKDWMQEGDIYDLHAWMDLIYISVNKLELFFKVG